MSAARMEKASSGVASDGNELKVVASLSACSRRKLPIHRANARVIPRLARRRAQAGNCVDESGQPRLESGLALVDAVDERQIEVRPGEEVCRARELASQDSKLERAHPAL